MFCMNCGSEIGEDDAFCTVCGTKTVPIQQPKEDSPVESEQSQQEPIVAEQAEIVQEFQSPVVQPDAGAQDMSAPTVEQEVPVQASSSAEAGESGAKQITQAVEPVVVQSRDKTIDQPVASPIDDAAVSTAVPQQPASIRAAQVFQGVQPQGATVAAAAPSAPVTSEDSASGDGGSVFKNRGVVQNGIIIAVIVVLIVAVAAAAIVTGGFGLIGTPVKSSVNEYTWSELSKISEEISASSDEGSAIDVATSYNLTTADGKLDGSQVKDVQLSNGQNVQVQITGFWHDDKTGGGKAGITFAFKDVMVERNMNQNDTNAGGWEASHVRQWLATEGINMLPSDLQDCIVSVNKSTNNTGKTENASSVTTTSDKLWLYSYVELVGLLSESDFSADLSFLSSIYNAEGSKYKLYRDMGVSKNSPNEILYKTLNGVASGWWERSPDPCFDNYFLYASNDGDPYDGSMATQTQGLVPGFCI